MPDFHSLLSVFSPYYIISVFGVLGVLLVIFAESGLLIGIVFPGDSLLFTAGLLASQGILHMPTLLVGGILAAVIGDSTGYAIGRKMGHAYFDQKETFYFKKEYALRARTFFEKHGARAILIARFVPIIRTLVPTLAGISHMPYKTFIKWNAVGGILWAAGITSIGYTLGAVVPGVEHYLTPIILAIILISLIPTFTSLFPKKRTSPETSH